MDRRRPDSSPMRWPRTLGLVLNNLRQMAPVLWYVDRWLFLGSGALTLLRSGVPALTLLLTKRLVDLLAKAVQSQQIDWQPLLWVIGLQAALEVGALSLSYLQDLLTLRQTQKVEFHLQLRLLTKSSQLPLSDYARPGFYDKLQQARQGLSFRGVRWLEQTANLIRQGAGLVSVLIVIGQVQPVLALVLFAMIIPTVWVQMNFGGLRFLQMRFQTPAVRQLSYLSELLAGQIGAAEVRLFGTAGFLKSRWERLFRQNAGEAFQLRRRGVGMSLWIDLANVLVNGLAILVLITTRGEGRLTVGDYVIVVQAFQTVRSLGGTIASALAQIFEDALFVTDLLEFLALPEGTSPSAGRPFPSSLRNGIDVVNLTFRYPEAPAPSVKNVSFQIRPGERIAIVGENGSGKSTLVKCLLGLYQPEGGAVYFDDVASEWIEPRALRANVTAVFQDFVTYQFTVRENITVGDIDRMEDPGRLQDALDRSGAREFVERLPNGVDTQLGAMFSGIDLSKGQWQKLALARAFYRESQVIVMDEPTASLDPKTEAMLFEQFVALSTGKTALLVSHRLGMCHQVDRILVMKQGELVEQGTHAELIANGGEYARMYQLQASWYDGSASQVREEVERSVAV